MNISPVNFTGTIYFPNQHIGVNTDHIAKFQQGSGGRTQVHLSNGEAAQLTANINEFTKAYRNAIKSKDSFIEVKTQTKPPVNI